MSRPSSIRLDVAFRVKGLGAPTVVDLGLEFEVSAPEATIMHWDGSDWRAAAQRVWTGGEGWLPGVE